MAAATTCGDPRHSGLTIAGVSWIDHIVEQQIADAIARNELEPAHLHGKPLDLDTPRGDGWWAEQFVRKERSKILREESLAERAARATRLWRAATVQELTAQLADANKWVVGVNQQLLPAGALDLFDPADVVATWRSARPA